MVTIALLALMAAVPCNARALMGSAFEFGQPRESASICYNR